MTSESSDSSPAPFKALLAGGSFIVVVLAVAGYSFRWTYYYNFGLHGLVLATPWDSLPLYAIEIARDRRFLLDLLWLALLYLLPFHFSILGLRYAARSESPTSRAPFTKLMRYSGLDQPVLVDAIRACLILLIAFRAGGASGYRNYVTNVVESTSRLPRATVVGATADSAEKWEQLACDKRPLLERGAAKTPRLVGDPELAISLAAGASCSSPGRSWRLLLRDERNLYLFATVSNATQRPQTLVIPESGQLTLILQ